MPGMGQPDQLPAHKLRVDGVVCSEAAGALGPTCIVTVPGTFTLRTEFGLDGNMDSMAAGDPYQVVHHWQRVEDGVVGTLPLAPQTPLPQSQFLSHISSPSPTYTTGPGGNLTVGTYRILTHIHFLPPNDHTHAGFYDGLIIMVVA